MHKLTENVLVEQMFTPVVSTDTTQVNGTGVLMAKYDTYTGVVTVAAAPDEDDVTLTLKESTDDTTYAALNTTVQATIATGASGTSLTVTLEARGEDMDIDSVEKYLRVEVVPDTSTAWVIAGLSLRSNPRYAQASLPTD